MLQGWIQVDTNNGPQESLAPKTMADMVYMDETQSQTIKDALSEASEAIQQRVPINLQVQLPTSGWSSVKPYIQTVTAVELLETDTPIADVVLSDNAATAINEIEAYRYIGRIDAEDGELKAYCYEEKPTVNLMIRLKVVR